ncbi:RraA family protein [Bartonella sp. AR 15-3]|uniref:RraA family protein n=1 Tax=Bartonella sp. AR 15-3 TaxID=545617 RepID=UPI0001F4CAC2|nr:RraA family protein [Bartonella sp. AR 15-3]OPB31290.1 Regulator of RNase E activity RraA [Bartonella sp. AR 15-3]CBI79674.1 putative Similar to transferase protein [Bartonella sp. AR 15-3]
MIPNENTEILKKRLLALDTAAVSDALDSLYLQAALPHIKPRLNNIKIAGPVFTVQYEKFTPQNQQFANAGNYIDDVPAGSIIVIDNNGRCDCTSWGNILTHKALQQKIVGTIIHGSARDIAEIRALHYPLFTTNIYMVSGKNRTRVRAVQAPLIIEGIKIIPGDWVFADDNGVLILPSSKLSEIIKRAENVDKTEARILAALKDGKRLENIRVQEGYEAPWKEKL